MSYSELQRLLGVKHTGKLNYHLKVLGDLVEKDKDSDRYVLSEKGKEALTVLGKSQGIVQLRPNGITIIGGLMIFGGAALSYNDIPTLLGWIGSKSNPFYVFGLSASAASLLLWLGMISCGIGLLYSRGWAWPATISVLLVLVLAEALETVFFISLVPASVVARAGLSLAASATYGLAPSLVAVALAVYYLTRPRIKIYFGKGTTAS